MFFYVASVLFIPMFSKFVQHVYCADKGSIIYKLTWNWLGKWMNWNWIIPEEEKTKKKTKWKTELKWIAYDEFSFFGTGFELELIKWNPTAGLRGDINWVYNYIVHRRLHKSHLLAEFTLEMGSSLAYYCCYLNYMTAEMLGTVTGTLLRSTY